MAESNKKIAIVGSGLIGRSWSMLFAGSGYFVSIYDIVPAQVQNALTDVKHQLQSLEKSGMLRGRISAEEQFALISGTSSLPDLVAGAFFVLECVPERLEIKRSALSSVDSIMEPDAILASSTSAILPSLLAEGMKHAKTFIVTHPVNPPYYVPLVELVPSPWTKPEVVVRTRELMKEIGQSPVTINKELPGFALNRVQYALMNECFNLVKDGVLTPEDVDVGLHDGIGRRYAFIGPLESMHLNAEGIRDYLAKYSETIFKTSQQLGPILKLEGATADKITDSLLQRTPVDKLEYARSRRDLALTALAKLIKDNPYKP